MADCTRGVIVIGGRGSSVPWDRPRLDSLDPHRPGVDQRVLSLRNPLNRLGWRGFRRDPVRSCHPRALQAC